MITVILAFLGGAAFIGFMVLHADEPKKGGRVRRRYRKMDSSDFGGGEE